MSKIIGNRLVPTTLAVSVALACVVIGEQATAATIDVGNADIEMRWDNTVRYNAGVRMEDRNPAFYNSPAYDETEGRFKKHDVVTNRVDLLSEMDFVYKGKYGVRVSGAAWADGAYGDNSLTNPALTAPSNYRNGRYNSYAKRYIAGPSGEILDAFVFGTFDLGPSTINLKLGKHNVYWGESLFSVGNSIAYSQGPVDTIKAATSPGVEAKETFLPLAQLSAQAQLTSDLSVGLQYALDWEPYRLVPGGTYFGTGDATRSDFAATAPLQIPNGPDLRPSNRGDFGVSVRWNPEWLNGTFGAYYRKFDEKLPWGATQLRGIPVAPFALPTAIRLNYARDTEMLGFSLSKNLGSMSVGAETSYRRNTALNSTGINVVTPVGAELDYERAEGARGNTFHALVNAIYLLPETPLWTGGSLNAELNYSRLLSVTKNANRFNGVGYACPAGRGKIDGCATRDAWGMNVSFTPQWPQALPGWDLSMPVTLAHQISGNGAALGGGNEGSTTWSIGVAGTLYSRYDFALRYVDAHGQYRTNAAGIASQINGNTPVQNNHGWLSFTFKTTF